MIQSSEVFCPYCGQLNEISVDYSIDIQEYVEDCTVCCRPMTLSIYTDEDGHNNVDARSDND